MRLLSDMAIFVEVANTKHFARAAASLGMPASTLSRRIRVLEKEIGVALIQRSTRSFALTEAGSACYERSRNLIAEAKRIQEDIGGFASHPKGHVRIGVPSDLAQAIFLPIFSEFTKANAGITLEVLSIHGHPNLLTEALDVAILVAHQTSLPDSNHIARRIGSFSRKLFAAERYLAEHPPLDDPSALAQHHCVLFSYGTVQHRWDLRRGREHRTVEVWGPGSANTVGMLAQMAREQMGVAILPDFLAQHSSFGDGLVRVLPEWEAVPAHVFAVTPAQIAPAKTRTLVNFVKSRFNVGLERCASAH